MRPEMCITFLAFFWAVTSAKKKSITEQLYSLFLAISANKLKVSEAEQMWEEREGFANARGSWLSRICMSEGQDANGRKGFGPKWVNGRGFTQRPYRHLTTCLIKVGERRRRRRREKGARACDSQSDGNIDNVAAAPGEAKKRASN